MRRCTKGTKLQGLDLRISRTCCLRICLISSICGCHFPYSSVVGMTPAGSETLGESLNVWASDLEEFFFKNKRDIVDLKIARRRKRGRRYPHLFANAIRILRLFNSCPSKCGVTPWECIICIIDRNSPCHVLKYTPGLALEDPENLLNSSWDLVIDCGPEVTGYDVPSDLQRVPMTLECDLEETTRFTIGQRSFVHHCRSYDALTSYIMSTWSGIFDLLKSST